ncbi:MAG TPA: 16S rRNA (adenine(1518)-N(6)/adenine(1519)-N(6))-dimethyltransferase RsmA [Dehalococcoidia bacterium]|nr:16S rRNA (adenine(1518)-N(6)/adenine(1519)-N(6))-dimethyltransferase RsmA [Dehalococcoidia bacterium]
MSTSSTDGEGEERPPSEPPLILLRQAKSLLRRLGKRPLKSLGQHFLVDTGVLGKIVAAARLTEQDTVIEVGPGLGILTQELARHVDRVIAVELDPALAGFLRQTLAPYKNVTIVQADILRTDPAALLQGPYKVVADLPYNIAAPTLRHFLEAEAKPELIVVMVQREVARRIAAEPGDMSPLSIGIQLYGHPTIAAIVPPRSFYPSPKVHSAILRIEVHPKPAVDVPPDSLFRVVRAGFGQPRKQLRNTLAAGLGLKPPEAESLLATAGIDARRRPETLSLEEWAALTRAAGTLVQEHGGMNRKPSR